MVSVPKPLLLIFERIHHKLDACGSVGNEHDIELFRIRVEHSKKTQADILDALSRHLRGVRGRVRVAVEIRHHVRREAFDERLGVQRSSGMVEVNRFLQSQWDALWWVVQAYPSAWEIRAAEAPRWPRCI